MRFDSLNWLECHHGFEWDLTAHLTEAQNAEWEANDEAAFRAAEREGPASVAAYHAEQARLVLPFPGMHKRDEPCNCHLLKFPGSFGERPAAAAAESQPGIAPGVEAWRKACGAGASFAEARAAATEAVHRALGHPTRRDASYESREAMRSSARVGSRIGGEAAQVADAVAAAAALTNMSSSPPGSPTDGASFVSVRRGIWGIEMVGKRVQVYWGGDEAWYAGVVDKYVADSGEHVVLYDDQQKGQYDLGLTQWRLETAANKAQATVPDPEAYMYDATPSAFSPIAAGGLAAAYEVEGGYEPEDRYDGGAGADSAPTLKLKIAKPKEKSLEYGEAAKARKNRSATAHFKSVFRYGQCERNPWCVRGSDHHHGRGGKCSSGISKKRSRAAPPGGYPQDQAREPPPKKAKQALATWRAASPARPEASAMEVEPAAGGEDAREDGEDEEQIQLFLVGE